MTTTLTRQQITEVVERHFGDVGNNAVSVMVAIVLAESRGKVNAVNDNYPKYQSDPNSLFRYDYGLAQINSVHNYKPALLVTDPDYNLAAARDIYNRQGFNAWTTYRNGDYLKYYEEQEMLSKSLTFTQRYIMDAALRVMGIGPARVIPLPMEKGKARYKIVVD